MSQEFESVIGIEIHAQINTKSKMFCRCDNDSFDKEPNLNVCEVCMGFPGQLPVINKLAVKKGIIAALALNCKIPEYCKFDRKNVDLGKYFTPISKPTGKILSGCMDFTPTFTNVINSKNKLQCITEWSHLLTNTSAKS